MGTGALFVGANAATQKTGLQKNDEISHAQNTPRSERPQPIDLNVLSHLNIADLEEKTPVIAYSRRNKTVPLIEDTRENFTDDHRSSWNRFMSFVRYRIRESVLAASDLAARNPCSCIWSVVFLSFGLAVVGLFTNFSMDIAPDRLYTPKDSSSREHRSWIENESGFEPFPRTIRLLIHAEGKNVLGEAGVNYVFDAISLIKDIPGYDELCAESSHVGKDGKVTCNIRSVALFWDNDMELYKEDIRKNMDIVKELSGSEFPNEDPVDVDEIFGNAETDGATLTFVQSYPILIILPGIEASEQFELEAIDRLNDLRDTWKNDGNQLDMEFMTYVSLEEETTRAAMKDTPLIALVFITMSLFTCFMFSKLNRVQSRGLLGVGAVFCVLLSLSTSYGLMFVIGIPFTSLAQMLPFIMFGIGLDDSFIIHDAYSRTNHRMDPVDRVRETFQEVGVSIFLTTLTTSCAFALGLASSLPSVSWLAFYSFTTVVIDFVYQITFFPALIVLDERRIQANRRDCCFCFSPRKTESLDFVQQTSVIDRFMAMHGKQVVRPPVKYFVILSFLALFGFSLYNTSNFTQEFELTQMFPKDSYVPDYIDAVDTYAQRGWTTALAYFRNVDQSNELVQEEMEEYINSLVRMDAISEQPEYFWLRTFKYVLTVGGDRLSNMTFNEQLDVFLSVPTLNRLYGDHIVRDEEGNLIASSCLLNLDNIDMDLVSEQLATREDIINATVTNPANAGTDKWNFFLYYPDVYVWDMYSVAVAELTFSLGMGVTVVTIAGFCFIPHWTATLFLFPLMSASLIDMIGILQVLGIHLNIVSNFAIVVSIGLMVDFNMHVLFRYYESREVTRTAKVIDMLQSMGSSVFVGGLSTFLGVLPLAFSTSEIMRNVFLAFVVMVLVGLGHGLVLLPALLSVFGPINVMTSGFVVKNTGTSWTATPNESIEVENVGQDDPIPHESMDTPHESVDKPCESVDTCNNRIDDTDEISLAELSL